MEGFPALRKCKMLIFFLTKANDDRLNELLKKRGIVKCGISKTIFMVLLLPDEKL